MARPKKTLKPEEEKAAQLARDLNEHMDCEHLIPAPTYFFNVGDSVHIGNLLNSIIQEVLLNGKLYRIQYSVKYTNYGNPYIEDGLERYVWWYEVRPVSTNTESLFAQNDMKLSYTQRTIESLLIMRY